VAQAITADTARCPRLDLYVDWQGGWHLDFAEGADERNFVKRVHADVDRHSVNGQVTGFDIGKGIVRARIYNKTVEMQKAKQEWYPTLLTARSGQRFSTDTDLWRLEFQLRREGVKGFRLYAKPEMTDPDEVIDAELEAEDLPHIHSVRQTLHWAGQIFTYLTKRWLRLVVPTDDPNRGAGRSIPRVQRCARRSASWRCAGHPNCPRRTENWSVQHATVATGASSIGWR
jgi:hypothetical protein